MLISVLRFVSVITVLVAGAGARSLAADGTQVTDTLESPEWLLNDSQPAPGSTKVDAIIDSVLRPLLRTWGSEPSPGSVEWHIDTVGTLSGRIVIDITCSPASLGHERTSARVSASVLKAVAVEAIPERFRLVHVVGIEGSRVYISPSFIGSIEGTEILASDCVMEGTGAYHIEDYWVWSEVRQVPVVLTRSVIGRAFDKMVPRERKGRVVGKFDPRRKSLDLFTTRRDSCTWVGRAHLDLGLDGDRLVVRAGEFTFGEFVDAQRYHNTRAHDSSCIPALPVILDTAGINRPNFNDDWRYYNADDHAFELAPPSISLNSLVAGFTVRIPPEQQRANPLKPPFQWSLDTIGFVSGRPVVECLYSFQCTTCRDTSGTILAAEVVPTRYRLLYLNKREPAASDRGNSRLFVREGDTLIYTRASRNYNYVDNYWRWDPEKQEPVSLFQQWVVDETVTLIAPKYLPERTYILPHKGSWNAADWSYNSPVWRQGDSAALPTGGSAVIKFSLKNHRMQPVSIICRSSSE